MYLNKIELKDEIKKSQDTGVITKNCHLMMYDISKNYIRGFHFPQTGIMSYEDVITICYLKAISCVNKYKDFNTSVFSYFTQIIHNECLQCILKSDRQKYYKMSTRIDENGDYELISKDDLNFELYLQSHRNSHKK
jgi:uncharacterized protein involved in tolerance to divalent cations